LIDSELEPHVLERVEERLVDDVRAILCATEDGRGVGEDDLLELEPVRVLPELLLRGVEDSALLSVEVAEVDFQI